MIRAAPSPSRDFRNLASTQAEEDSFDYRKARATRDPNAKFTSTIGSIAHIVKGALGGGILSGPVSYMKAGVAVAIPLNVIFGIYMTSCLWLLVDSTQKLYRRTRIPSMSYADVGEASAMTNPNKTVQSCSKIFRYTIDAIICMDLFGACCCYQIIIANTIKQLVENVHEISFEPSVPGYPSLRVYLAIMIPVLILVCLIRHLKALAPLSIVANIVVVICIFVTIYYAFQYNPSFSGLKLSTTTYDTFAYVGMSVFSMSCSGVVIAIETNMDKPNQYNIALTTGMGSIIFCIFLISFFGYSAFLEDCKSPITLNFPMTLGPKLLKGLIAAMIYVTHALNFWVPFNLCFYYLKKKHPPEKQVMMEYIYRALFVTGIGIVAIVFPDINALMGFIGCFCLSNMAFIWPNIITLMVIWHRPGLGHMKWKLWRGVLFIGIGLFIFICGSMVNAMEMVEVFVKVNQ